MLVLRLPGDSGQPPRDVPLRFLRRGDTVYVFGPPNPRAQWMAALDRGAAARWWIGEEEFAGRGRLLADADPETRDLRSRAEAVWGAASLGRWFRGPPAIFALIADRAGPATYYESLEALFGASAADYDGRLAANPIERIMREASLGVLTATFPAGSRLLELGCGTGAETLPLAGAGMRVVAVDLSAEMLARLASKADAQGVSANVRTIRAHAGDLASVVAEFGSSSFDGAFSTFGALNTEPNWRSLPAALAQLVRPGGRIVLGVWNRACAAEMALYALRGRPRRALSRLADPVPVGVSRFGVPVRAFSVATFLGPFRPYFALGRLIGLPVLVPPYDFWAHAKPLAPLIPALARADAAVRDRFPWNRLGDHFLAVLHRRANRPEDAGQRS